MEKFRMWGCRLNQKVKITIFTPKRSVQVKILQGAKINALNLLDLGCSACDFYAVLRLLCHSKLSHLALLEDSPE